MFDFEGGVSERRYTSAFRMLEVVRAEPAKAAEAFIAIYRLAGAATVVIGAASLDELAQRWSELTDMPLDRSQAQRVIITAWRPSDGTP